MSRQKSSQNLSLFLYGEENTIFFTMFLHGGQFQVGAGSTMVGRKEAHQPHPSAPTSDEVEKHPALRRVPVRSQTILPALPQSTG
jgi:hypothetical protein